MQPTRRSFVKLAAAGGIAVACRLPSQSASFFAAVREGVVARVGEWLDRDPGLIRALDPGGRTAFALALLEGHRDVADLLLARGYEGDLHESALALDWERFAALAAENRAALEEDHPVGGTAMYAAARGGAGSDIWRVYAETGSPNPDRGGAPLVAALRIENLALAEMTAATLLANGADPEPVGLREATPLQIAAGRGSFELVEMLVRLGARVDATDRRGRTPRDLAAEGGHRATVRLLEHTKELPRTHSTSRTAGTLGGGPYAPPAVDDLPLARRSSFVGSAHFRLDDVRRLTREEPRLAHSVATTGERAVEACAHTGQHEIVEHLLEHGAPYSLPTAVMRGDRARVIALLDEDPLRIHERGAHDFALLWYPIIGRDKPELLELLLARGAEVERQHFLGTTALHWAAMREPIETIELLLEAGAEIDRVGRKFEAEGQTPLQCAAARDRADVVRFLKERGAKG